IFKSSNNRIGIPDAGNVIAFNNGNGVFVKNGEGNAISRNSIFANAGLGIRLQDNANNRQAAPVLTAAGAGPAGGFVVAGTLTSTRNTTFTVELFGNKGPTGSREGRVYLGTVQVTTDAAGFATFSFTGMLPPGITSLTATAT